MRKNNSIEYAKKRFGEEVVKETYEMLSKCIFDENGVAPEGVQALGFKVLQSQILPIFPKESTYCLSSWVDIGTQRISLVNREGLLDDFVNAIFQEIYVWEHYYHLLREAMFITKSVPAELSNLREYPLDNIQDYSTLVNFVKNYINIGDKGIQFLKKHGYEICEGNYFDLCEAPYISIYNYNVWCVNVEYAHTLSQYIKPRAMCDIMLSITNILYGEILSDGTPDISV